MVAVKIKICGITNADDARCAIDAGVDYLGLIFAASKRRVIRGQAKMITESCPDFISWVGVFQNGKKKEIEELVSGLPITTLQFHGNETPAFCNYFVNRGFTVIKTIPVYQDKVGINPRDYPKVPFFLLDSVQNGACGGVGIPFSWDAIDRYDLGAFRKKVILAGGLSVDNVAEAIMKVHPYGVDVSSQLEDSPGRKNHEKIRDFIKAVNE